MESRGTFEPKNKIPLKLLQILIFRMQIILLDIFGPYHAKKCHYICHLSHFVALLKIYFIPIGHNKLRLQYYTKIIDVLKILKSFSHAQLIYSKWGVIKYGGGKYKTHGIN